MVEIDFHKKKKFKKIVFLIVPGASVIAYIELLENDPIKIPSNETI